MIKNCPICGKAFDVLYPDIWRYKRNNRFLCSWKCIRLFDGKEEKQVKERVSVKKTRMIRDDMAEAVRMWKANDPGLDQYLTDHGITHIGKWKQNARDRYGVAAPVTVKVDGPLKIETNESEKIEVVTEQKPLKPGLRGLNNSDFTVSAIKHPQLGEFYYDQKFNSVDWRSPECEEISLHPAMWKELYMIIPDVMGILGVPDHE